MTRLLEFIVALILVVVLAVVVGVVLPSHGHVERSIEISHNLRHTWDTLNNFRNFPTYSALTGLDPRIEYASSGEDYGPGSEISWKTASQQGNGSLEIVSSELDKEIVWKLTNDWRGNDKHYTITLDPSDNGKLVKITMSYDVEYGWNFIDRYSQLYLHGHPATFMQYTLDNLQSMLANIPNIGYDDLDPVLMDRPRQPMLLVSTQAPRTLDDIAVATDKALSKLQAAAKELGLEQTGPYVTFTTNWGDQNYAFDIGIPVNSSVIEIADESIDLADAPSEDELKNMANGDDASSDDTADTGDADDETVQRNDGPGTFDESGNLRITDDVYARMMFGERALVAALHGGPAQLPLIRLALKAYASTHGYDFNEFAKRLYDIDVSDPDNEVVNDREYRIYLPVSTSPKMTPWQKKHPEEAARIINNQKTGTAAEQESTDMEAANETAPQRIDDGK